MSSVFSINVKYNIYNNVNTNNKHNKFSCDLYLKSINNIYGPS